MHCCALVVEKLPVDVRQAVDTLKNAILQSQYRAAKAVNREQLSLYFGIGRYISEHSRNGVWGTGAIERISEQLFMEKNSNSVVKAIDFNYSEFIAISFTHHTEILHKVDDIEERLAGNRHVQRRVSA